ncbi:MAG: hypothetical protein WC756_18385 [Taibaiella sp.]|jgi:hypothetical protein
MLQRIILTLLLLNGSYALTAQSITSPYSILGIGDIESKDFGKFFGMSSTSLAMRSASFINLNNPASLTALDPNMLNIDMNSRWRSSSFQYPAGDSFTSSYNDAAIRRLSLTFRPNQSWGFSFGIKPYSTVNYLIDEKLALRSGGSTSIDKTVTGSGGISQVYLANGIKLSKNFSVGLTASYLFGSLTRNTLYYYEDLGINISRNEYEKLSGFQFQGGFQYTGKTGEHITHNIGITLGSPTSLKGDYEIEYIENDTVMNSSSSEIKTFKVPLQFGIGYACIINDMITIAADYNRWNWASQKLDYPNAYTHASQRFSLGFQYAPQKSIQGQMREKVFIQAGVSYEQGYIAINNKQINDMSASVGLGSNLSRLINVYIGLEVGKKGNVNDGQIKENYTQISAGVTLKEFWYNAKKMRRYQ